MLGFFLHGLNIPSHLKEYTKTSENGNMYCRSTKDYHHIQSDTCTYIYICIYARVCVCVYVLGDMAH